MVELGNRVDERICETYLRNCDVGADSGVTLRDRLDMGPPDTEKLYSQFLGHLRHEAGHKIHIIIQVLCYSSCRLVLLRFRLDMLRGITCRKVVKRLSDTNGRENGRANCV
jgi:hypothetical protein